MFHPIPVRQAKQTSASGQHDANATAQDESAFFNAEQVSYSTLRARARQNKNEANAQLELHTKTLVERLQQVEAAAFQGDEVAVQTYISDARQMVTELRQAHILFPKEKVEILCDFAIDPLYSSRCLPFVDRASNFTSDPR